MTAIGQKPAFISGLEVGPEVTIHFGGDWASVPGLRAIWHGLAVSSGGLEAVYQTPAWYEHLGRIGRAHSVGVASNHSGAVVGIAPLARRNFSLKFGAKGRVFLSRTFRTASVPGCLPLFPDSERLYDALFAAIREGLPDVEGVHFESVADAGFVSGYLDRSCEVRSHWLPYRPLGDSLYNTIALPDTFERYLERFGAKGRYSLKRKVNSLAKHGGRLELIRVDSLDAVPMFLEASRSIAMGSWQKSLLMAGPKQFSECREVLEDLAASGLLRSYLLRCGGEACAFILGAQVGDAYHFMETAYDPAFAEDSPGKVILYLALKDVIEHRRPGIFSFGAGHTPYKGWFGDIGVPDATVILLRRRGLNGATLRLHRSFQETLKVARDRVIPALLPRRAARKSTTPEGLR